MGESVKSDKTSKIVKLWNCVKTEFKKITWPDREDLMKQSVAVVVISVIVGLIITVLDFGMQYGVDFITTLKF